MTYKLPKGQLFITCEHAGNSVPDDYRHLFTEATGALSSHRGLDIGILKLAKTVAENLCSPIYYSETTRLLVDLNRSDRSKTLFSEYTSHLPAAQKKRILSEFYYPYRKEVEHEIRRLSSEKGIVHIAFHSFTPELNGVIRNAEIGLLYDPKRPAEKAFCSEWKKSIKKSLPGLRIRMNYPYKGISDCLPASIRKKIDGNSYSGIELEVNQALFDDRAITPRIEAAITESLQSLLHQ